MSITNMTKLIKEDMKPALGVTEPGAIAFAVAKARSRLITSVENIEESIRKVEVSLNSGMYKNAYTCGIPNSDHYGNVFAAALGAVAADPKRGLLALEGITEADNARAERLVRSGKVEVEMESVSSEIMIRATVSTAEESCTVLIQGAHTNIVRIEKNKNIIYEKENQYKKRPDSDKESVPVIHRYSLHEILTYVNTVPIEEIEFIAEAFTMNLALLEEGLDSGRTQIAQKLLKENNGQRISSDARKTAQLLCNGAIEARVLGLSSPAMSITGSGAHGIIATMPLYAWQSVSTGQTDPSEILLRATALSFLITMYIKEYSGKLSAFCGCGIAAGTGMACGLALLRGADEKQIGMVIQNMASGLTGMICDGGNHGCTMKGIVAVDAAFSSVELALENICIDKVHGINGKTPEDTMRHMGLIASPGMEETEKTIVDIMKRKS